MSTYASLLVDGLRDLLQVPHGGLVVVLLLLDLLLQLGDDRLLMIELPSELHALLEVLSALLNGATVVLLHLLDAQCHFDHALGDHAMRFTGGGPLAFRFAHALDVVVENLKFIVIIS